MKKLFLTILTIIILAAGFMGYRLMLLAGMFTPLPSVLEGQCEQLPMPAGGEDFAIDKETGYVFVSSSDRLGIIAKTAGPGAISVFHVDDPMGTKRQIDIAIDDFQPHGIDFLVGADGTKYLFVIDHPTENGRFAIGGHKIHTFKIESNNDLTLLRTAQDDDIMYAPNDVVAINETQFYVTNDRGHPTDPLLSLEHTIALPLTTVAFFDGTEARYVAKNLASANGITKNPDGSIIYVAEVIGRKAVAFERQPDNDLERVKNIHFGTNPDNILMDDDGFLWTGAHPQVFELLKYFDGEAEIAPSHVVRVAPDTGERETFFASKGADLSGSTVALKWQDKFYVGSVGEPHILICPFNE